MYLIIGSGLSGSVIAEHIANILNEKVIIIEKKSHIGGMCYDYIDKETGILISKYGAHPFHTNYDEVWNYINKFCQWKHWEHKVLAEIDHKIVPIPVNITTVNEIFNLHIDSEEEMNEWLDKNQEKYDKIENSEQMAKSRIGGVLYEKLVKHFTFKQWRKYPEELDKSVLERVPIKNNFDNRYFKDKYQALPVKGYTYFISKLLENDNIQVLLETDFLKFSKENDLSQFKKIIFTGPIDSYFNNLEKLEYLSINFKMRKYYNMNYYQQNSVINFPDKNNLYTRTVEYKHFLNQLSRHTVVVSETFTDEGEKFYPIPDKRNLELYEKYKKLGENEENVYFIGMLANYKYINMDEAIKNAINFFNNVLVH